MKHIDEFSTELNIDALEYFKQQTKKYFMPGYQELLVTAATLKGNGHYRQLYLSEPQYHIVHNRVLVIYVANEIKECFRYNFINAIFDKKLNYQTLLRILPIKKRLEKFKTEDGYLIFDLEKYLNCEEYQSGVKYLFNHQIIPNILYK